MAPGTLRTARQRLGIRRLLWRRRRVAARHLRGDGIEIGALHQPLPLPARARARYVDRYDVEGLRAHYPELAALPLVPVDVVDDGERLAAVPDGSVDFVVASHFIEHTQDPLRTIREHVRVLRPGGTVLYVVPDQRTGIDAHRPLTPLAHVVRDFQEGPEQSRRGHYREWAALVDGAEDPEAHGAWLEAASYSIHFHAWTPETFSELVGHARDTLAVDVELVALVPNRSEFVVALRRRS